MTCRSNNNSTTIIHNTNDAYLHRTELECFA